MKKTIIFAFLSIVFGVSGYSARAVVLAPVNITAIPKSPTEIDLNWSTSTEAVSYEIYRNSTSTPIASTTKTNFSDAGLLPKTTYIYYVAAIDASSTRSELSAGAATSTLADIEAPSAPANLIVVLEPVTQANLSWQASSDNVGVAGYKIYKNGRFLATTSNLNYIDTGLAAFKIYQYQVSAYDLSGNESAKSAAVSVITAIDQEKPTAPENLTATAVSSSRINLSWSAAIDNFRVAGYKIYRNNIYRATTAGLSFADTGLIASTTYRYQVSAFDQSGNESDKSTTATATTFALSATTTNVKIAIFNGKEIGKFINIRSNQLVKIVVYSDNDFDARRIKNNSVRFGGAKAVYWRLADVNRDKKLDKIYGFRARDMKDLPDGEEAIAVFTAKTKDNVSLYAELAVKVKNPFKPKPAVKEKKEERKEIKIEQKIEKIEKKITDIQKDKERKIEKIEEKAKERIENLTNKMQNILDSINQNKNNGNNRKGKKK